MKKNVFCLSLILLFISCQVKEKSRISDLVKEWVGKEVIFPDVMKFELSEYNDDSLFLVNDYKILAYVDSFGCFSCKLRLREWKKLIVELDSLPILFNFAPRSVTEVESILKENGFKYPVYVDVADTLNKLNHFPTDERFQTFLLDKNNKVLAIGNPIHNPKVKELYMKIILGDKALKKKDEIKTMAEVGASFINLGEFDWKVEQKATFKLKNTGEQPLVILDVTTSCGCISAEFPKEPLAAGKEAEIAVVYKADKPEHFNKTVTVYCNAENAPCTVKVTGTAK